MEIKTVPAIKDLTVVVSSYLGMKVGWNNGLKPVSQAKNRLKPVSQAKNRLKLVSQAKNRLKPVPQAKTG